MSSKVSTNVGFEANIADYIVIISILTTHCRGRTPS